MAKKTITKEHPLTTFRKANDARNAMVKKSLPKAQVGGTSMTPKKETLAEQNTRIKKEIVAREKRILTKEKKDERNSYSNSRANKVVGK
jgi:hypothetical protein